jgi:hypothetical protein
MSPTGPAMNDEPGRQARWQELTKSECFRLLAGQRLGRVAVMDDQVRTGKKMPQRKRVCMVEASDLIPNRSQGTARPGLAAGGACAGTLAPVAICPAGRPAAGKIVRVIAWPLRLSGRGSGTALGPCCVQTRLPPLALAQGLAQTAWGRTVRPAGTSKRGDRWRRTRRLRRRSSPLTVEVEV